MVSLIPDYFNNNNTNDNAEQPAAATSTPLGFAVNVLPCLGAIPPEMGQLAALQTLHLNLNQLSGEWSPGKPDLLAFS